LVRFLPPHQSLIRWAAGIVGHAATVGYRYIPPPLSTAVLLLKLTFINVGLLLVVLY
jgi:hypothetical protein